MRITFSSSIAIGLFALFYVPTFALFGLGRRHGLDRRLVCVEDDVYDGFHNAPQEDARPYCSSRLGIQDILSTRVGFTSRTTTITTTTIYTPTVSTTTTISLATVTVTIGDLKARDAAPAPTAAAQFQQLYEVLPIAEECDESPGNKSLISAVNSACSCLLLTPQTVDVLVTTISTRLQTADDYEPANAFVTNLAYSTVTVTVSPIPLTNGTVLVLPTLTNSTVSVLPTLTNSTFTGSSALPTSSTPSAPSFNISVSPIPSQNTSVPPTSPPLPPTTSAPISSGSSPIAPVNNISSVSASTISVSTTGPGPTAAPFSVCPGGDKSVITESDGEQFQVLCFTNFTGPTTVGLREPSLGSCVEQCALNNQGFSATNCYGASFFPDQTGANCYLKTEQGVATADYNPAYRIVSGVLLAKPNSTSTNNTSTSLIPSSTPTGASNNTGTIPPFGAPTDGGRSGNNPGSSSSASGSPTGPLNSTSSSVPTSGFPVASVNITISVGPSAVFTVSLNSSSPLLPGSAYPSPNSSLSGGPTAPPVSLNSTASLFPSATLNSTTLPSISPTPSYNLTSTPSGFPSLSYNISTATSKPYNASICYSTDFVTAYTTQPICSSTVTITATTTASATEIRHSATTTVTQIQVFTLTA